MRSQTRSVTNCFWRGVSLLVLLLLVNSLGCVATFTDENGNQKKNLAELFVAFRELAKWLDESVEREVELRQGQREDVETAFGCRDRNGTETSLDHCAKGDLQPSVEGPDPDSSKIVSSASAHPNPYPYDSLFRLSFEQLEDRVSDEVSETHRANQWDTKASQARTSFITGEDISRSVYLIRLNLEPRHDYTGLTGNYLFVTALHPDPSEQTTLGPLQVGRRLGEPTTLNLE